MATVESDPSARVESAAREALTDLRSGDTHVLEVEVSQYLDDDDADLGWWLTLQLSEPTGDTWPDEETSDLIAQARQWLNRYVAGQGWALPAVTIVALSSLAEAGADESMDPGAGVAAGRSWSHGDMTTDVHELP